jgi:hypothetical protein
MVRQNTAKLLTAQEDLTREAVRAKEELAARMSSGGSDSKIAELLDKVAALSRELLEEKKRNLKLLRELNKEKGVNKRPFMISEGRNQPEGKRSRTNLDGPSDITASLQRDSVKINLNLVRDKEGNTRREILQPSRKFPQTANQQKVVPQQALRINNKEKNLSRARDAHDALQLQPTRRKGLGLGF